MYNDERAGVGTHSRSKSVAGCKPTKTDTGVSGIGSHAGAWEPENDYINITAPELPTVYKFAPVLRLALS